jgi:hypothetical protein
MRFPREPQGGPSLNRRGRPMRKNCTVLLKSYMRGAAGTTSASAANSTLIEIKPNAGGGPPRLGGQFLRVDAQLPM